MKKRLLVLICAMGLFPVLLTGTAFAQPDAFFDEACLVEGGILLSFQVTEDVAAGDLSIELSDGRTETVDEAVAANETVNVTTSAGGTSVLRYQGTEIARTFVELEHIQDCERPGVQRLSGAGRIETSVAIAQQRFPHTADAVYLANANSFVDALSGAPMAYDGPVLLVYTDTLPAVVEQEIQRLDPAHLVVFGGAAAVSDDVLEAARVAAGIPAP